MKKLMHVSLMLVAALVFACGGDSTPDTDVVGDTPIGDQGDTKTDSVDTPDTPDDKEEPETKEDLVDNGDTETTPEGECSPATVDTDCAELCTDLDPCQECLCNVTIGGGTCEITNKENGASCDSGHECSINNTCEDDRAGHPSQKPLNVLRKIITASSKEGDTVLDPFIGSGTTAVACKQLRRNFIGFEISQKYVDIANKRLQQDTLFDYDVLGV